MRLFTSGTFIDGNYWGADSVFGRSNISHGCVGLNDARGGGDPGQDGAWFYDHSLVGDGVVVKNSDDKTIAPDNGLNGWNMPWNQWKAGSASEPDGAGMDAGCRLHRPRPSVAHIQCSHVLSPSDLARCS